MRGRGILAATLLVGMASAAQAGGVRVTIPGDRPIDGRLILIVSPDATSEPRLQVHTESPLKSPYIFGETLTAARPGTMITIGDEAIGWPAATLSALPPGEYSVQAVLNRYERYRRAAGPAVMLPPDRGEGQHWESKPGNLYSRLVRVRVGGDALPPVLTLDQVVPPIPDRADTPFVKHVRIRSTLLSRWWGRPTYLGAYVLLPAGFDAHPRARYPLVVNHGHFPADGIDAFREAPPDPDLKPDYSERFQLAGYNRIQQQQSYANYQAWIAPGFPRFLVVQVEHANPYYDDSYAVNSANLGPYGDAINRELIPEIERRFRGIGQGWARFTYGGSTGGWEALATQVFYPDLYNGAFAACPDPIDFRSYTTIDLYADTNAYAAPGVATRFERQAMRDRFGNPLATQRAVNAMEAVLGDRARSGQQYDIWQAVFGPMGADGYPRPIWDKATGAIDPAVAAYWREHYDLTHIVARDWKTLGPKLAGKLNVYVGTADSYFLDAAVYRAQAVFEGLKAPAYGGTVDYGVGAEHCWNGDHTRDNAYSRLRYNLQYVPAILQRIAATAPKGADVTSWRY